MAPERLEGRNGDIWRRYVGGATQESLAERYGIDQSRVSQIISAVRASIPEQTRDALRQEHVDFLREIRDSAMALARAPLPPAVNNKGNVIIDPTTKEIVRDATGRLSALRHAADFATRAEKLLGLEPPAESRITITSEEETEAAARAAEALSRLHGDE
jgi:transcriptional regulator with XRE-family HTH domain